MGNYMKRFCIAAAFCFASSVAFAQTDPGFFPSGTVLGNNTGSSARPGAINSVVLNQAAGASQQALALVQAAPLIIAGNALQGNQVTTGDNGGAITGINGGGYAYNYVFVTGDARADYGTSPFTHGMQIIMQTGGAAARGSKIALDVNMIRTSADNTAQAAGDTIAGNFTALSNNPNGGTDTGAGARGDLFGLGVGAIAGVGAINYSSISGGEVDVAINTGASVKYRLGWSVVDTGNLSAANLDIGFEIGAASGPGFKTGLAITGLHGGHGIATTGTIIGTDGTAMTVAKGIDWTNITFTGNIITTSTFVVNSAGSVIGTQFLATNVVATATGTAIQAGGNAGMGFVASTTANFGTFFGSGAPTLSAAQGSQYLRSDGSTITRAYINTNGTTGWIPIISADVVPVGSLPTCNAGAEGARLGVNDSNAASFTAGIGTIVAAGGTTHVPVYCDKTNWRIG